MWKNKRNTTAAQQDKVFLTYIHEVFLHVMGKVLEHSDLPNKVFGNLAGGKDGALAQLCIVMDGPESPQKIKHRWVRFDHSKLKQTLNDVTNNFQM